MEDIMAKAKPTDATGVIREQLLEQNAEAMQERANEMSMATAQAKAKLETDIIDATVPDRQTVIVDEVITVGNSEDSVEIRVVENIENMTLGAGNNYNFKPGQKYRVTKAVAQHLKEKGYLAGVI
jgi:chemotaxis protein CheY-P-specific phosphatase CheC